MKYQVNEGQKKMGKATEYIQLWFRWNSLKARFSDSGVGYEILGKLTIELLAYFLILC